ncbi:hydroxymethylpyrimidine/phosphomethylpyrimidine kinase [Persicobacter sp. CCB-QB2]|uniref:hydroxymethylpyrimidine/phosphomethylpyrimidine kinase n=1 Tax=Persicobacter sp. CCB-QB2 TaxID=1561025 RepID=UPI0006A9DDB6|nr:hydroxymethylpyrimidine/phosphomethylpyrimidine kinase [Persicobacter sp. CCB-QB2]
MNEPRPVVLSIAGYDPSGGAGILADAKTFEQLECLGLTAMTCWTVQNGHQFQSAHWLTVEEVKSQIDAVIAGQEIQFVKIGLVKSWPFLWEIILHLKEVLPTARLILDPILSASAGFEFHAEGADFFQERILPHLFLLTPNQPEADKLGLNFDIPLSTNILLKGGHASGADLGTDLLCLMLGDAVKLTSDKGKLPDKHGTGCILSAAITANLAKGHSLEKACQLAKQYLEQCMESNPGILAYHQKTS